MAAETADKPIRANVYFDGFNFYHGCFRFRTQWKYCKWLNLEVFIQRVFPHYAINRIRYFTALVNPTADDPDQRLRQLTYLRALETIPCVTVHRSRFATNAKLRYAADPQSFDSHVRRPIPLEPLTKVGVIEEEEKGSDVNLASYLLVDAFENEYDVAIVVSNDSDLAEPIRLVRSRLARKVVLLNPRKQTALDLQGIADEYRQVRFGPLQVSQFPYTLHDENGVIQIPDTWKQPDR